MTQSIVTDDTGPALHRLHVALSRAADGRYALLISDESNIVLGRIYRPADAGGGAPRFEIADVLAQIGGAYRTGSVEIDLRCRDLQRRSVSVSRALKQCNAPVNSVSGLPEAASSAMTGSDGEASHV